uniref:Neuromedin-K n=1 Tax=Astatotilapia calliptera TaxID=8154 RepID=A0AAX7SUS4_ASTCA
MYLCEINKRIKCCIIFSYIDVIYLWKNSGGISLLLSFDDIGYDSFLGLMGRRNAALTNRDTDHSLADLLGWRTSECLWNQ